MGKSCLHVLCLSGVSFVDFVSLCTVYFLSCDFKGGIRNLIIIVTFIAYLFDDEKNLLLGNMATGPTFMIKYYDISYGA